MKAFGGVISRVYRTEQRIDLTIRNSALVKIGKSVECFAQRKVVRVEDFVVASVMRFSSKGLQFSNERLALRTRF